MNEKEYSTGKKVLSVFLGFTPLLAVLFLSVSLTILMGITAVIGSFRASGETGISFYELYLDTVLDRSFSDLLSIVTFSLCIVIFGVWFFLQFKKAHGPLIRGKGMNLTVLIGLAILVLGMQFVAMIVADLFSYAVPWALTDYIKMTELAGMNDPTLLTWISGVIIGPIAEELIFRGVTLHYLKRGLPFFLANIIHALLFGIYHMNLLQGVFAFVIGLFFGGIYYYGRSLIYPILAHMLFNLYGYVNVTNIGAGTRLYYYLWLPPTILFLALGCILYFERVNKTTREADI